MFCSPSDLSPSEVYRLLVGGIVPRPIAWVSTVSEDGVPNLAPFSFFTVASRNPATLAVSIGKREPERGEAAVKDSLVNIRATGEFVVHIANADLVSAVESSSADWPRGVNEFDVAAVTATSARTIAAPRVVEAPVAYECSLSHQLPLGDDVLVLGRVQGIHVDDGVLDARGRIDLELLSPLARMSGPRYATRLEEVTEPAPAVKPTIDDQHLHEVGPR